MYLYLYSALNSGLQTVLCSLCGEIDCASCVVQCYRSNVRLHVKFRDKASGMLKGDGLVTYLKRPSVELATNILDGTPFRPGMAVNMKVQEARFELKGEYKPPTKPKKKPKKSKVCELTSTLKSPFPQVKISNKQIYLVMKPQETRFLWFTGL